ncbi:uncharacterized protein LOC120987313 [Bufo bufo]|uniref:uncharacterized protein LOC120987313 n=1 Tax=Bufo bufo TaxID=8384 RepID=UPI001ABDAB6B|nr:uncharacterized protein LOC120987313 [Bufo bufo]
MRRTLLLCIQAALLASGSCLQCETCHTTSEVSDDCFGDKMQCNVNEMCLVLHLSIQHPEQYLATRAVKRQCWNYNYCYQSGVISTGRGRIQFTTACCSIDNCRMPLPDLPPEKNTHNGLVCPFCSSSLNTCVPETAMKCTGEENYCFTFTANKPSLSMFSGCSSSAYCNLYPLIGEIFRNNNMKLRPVNVTCTKATKKSPLPVVNFLFCLTCNGLVGCSCENTAICSPEHDACLTIILSFNHGSKQYTQQIKRCGLSSECGSAGTITTGHKNISKNTTCCYTTNCGAPIPTLPSENNETNGIQCESCYYKTYGFCTGSDYIACTGNATQCINYMVEQKDAFFTSREVFRGCAHPKLCKSGNRTVVDEFSSLKETVICGVPSKVGDRFPNELYIYFLLMIYALYIQW